LRIQFTARRTCCVIGKAGDKYKENKTRGNNAHYRKVDSPPANIAALVYRLSLHRSQDAMPAKLMRNLPDQEQIKPTL
jgi:hypothetical protein